MEDLTGMKFGRWLVLKPAEPKIYNGRTHRYWLCRCECGTERTVKELSLKSGKSQSCGCMHSDIMKEVGKRHATHGMTDTRLYRIYKHMLCRCNNTNDNRYELYGARGIKVCDEWNTFEKFAEWALQNGYRDDLTIDRINNDGNYEPSNCRWVDIVVQANNKSSNRVYEYNGESHNIKQWADIVGMNYKKLWKRLTVFNWDIARALTT